MPILQTRSKEKRNNIQLYYEDYSEGQPVILIHGWPLSHKMWEYQVPVLVEAGYRVITYDRRGFGQSDRPWSGYNYDSFASDLNDLMNHLDLSNVVLVGFSMGGGEVARFIGNYGTSKISKVVLMSAVTPFMLQTTDNPSGVDESVFEGIKTGITKDRAGFMKEFGKGFVGYEDNHENISMAQVDFNWNIAVHASQKATLDCVDAFGKTDFREDCKKIDTPTLVMHGNADAIVPMEVSGEKAKDIIPGAKFKIIDKAPHGLMFTHTEVVNEILIDFLRS